MTTYILTDVARAHFWTGMAFRLWSEVDESCYVPSLQAIKAEQQRQFARGVHLKIEAIDTMRIAKQARQGI